MSKNLITVWNASSGLVKIGAKKSVLKPAESVKVEQDAKINKLIDAGKLVVIAFAAEETTASDESTSRKKSKKDSTVVESKEGAETEVSESNQTEEPVVSSEISEDSILPEETA